MKLQQAEAIIFDLGGVVLNLDYAATERAFQALGIDDFSNLYSQAAQTGVFDEFETGKCSVPYFINKLLDFLPPGTSANQVVSAWNAMILHFPIENLQFLAELKKSKRIFLLSNTNAIHLQAVNRALESCTGEKSLQAYFERVYFSHEVGLRKPHKEIFDLVVKENRLNPKTTLFIDDTQQHIEGAISSGINAHIYPQNTSLTAYFQ
jgi:putative hydrolase of the HAD superfamily